MRQEIKLDNVLIFGNGPVALHFYLTLKNQNFKNIGLKIRNSLKSNKFLEELERENFILESMVQTDLPLVSYGKAKVQNLIRKSEEIVDVWETFVLATPCDAYVSLLKEIHFLSLKRIKTILLPSPEFGSAYFVKSILEKKGRSDIDVISFSNYFGATNLLGDFSTKIIVNALKRKIYLSSTNLMSKEVEKWVKYLNSMRIEAIFCKNPLVAESKNITTFVHSPFLFNEVSLNQIFSKDFQKKYLYKLYPEGPITKYLIRDMVDLYHEIMELYQKIGIETFNLLEFLNDNYPVLEETLNLDEIKNFISKTREEQSFLLYVRYSSILIDPYSTPDEEGRYFDFSRVEYSKTFLNKENKWCIPRRPSEDYKKLNLLFYLSEDYRTKNIVMKKFLSKYEEFYHEFILEKEIENIAQDSYLQSREEEAKELCRYIKGEF